MEKIASFTSILVVLLATSLTQVDNLHSAPKPGAALKSYANALLWTPDAKHIIALRDNEIVIHDATSLTPVLGAKEASSTTSVSPIIESLAASFNGALIATAGFEEGVWLWSMPKLKKVRKLDKSSSITSIQFDVAGSRVFGVGFDGPIGIWNVSTGALVSTLASAPSRILSIAIAPEGDLLATGNAEGKLRIQSLASRAVLARFEDLDGPISGIAFSPDGAHIAASSIGHELIVIETDGFREKYSLVAPAISVETQGRFFEGLITALTWVSAARTAQLAGAPGRVYVPTGGDHKFPELRCSVLFSADGKYFAFMRSSYRWPGRYSLEVYETDSGTRVSRTRDVKPAMAFSPKGYQIAVSTKDGIVALNARTGAIISRYLK
jgi:WD40 repeat protein